MLRLFAFLGVFSSVLLVSRSEVSAQNPNYLIEVGGGTVVEGASLDTVVSFDNVDVVGVMGIIYGVCHEAPTVELGTLDSGAAVITGVNGGPAFFEAFEVEPGGFNQSIIFGVNPSNSLPPGDDYELALVEYEGVAAGVSSLTFCTIAGLAVEVSDQFGSITTPVTAGSSIEVTPGATPELVFRAGSATGSVGDLVDVDIFLDNIASGDVAGWSFSVCHDTSLMQIEETAVSAAALAVTGGIPLALELALVSPGEGFIHSVLFSFTGTITIPPQVGFNLGYGRYELLAPGVSPVTMCGNIGIPPAENTVLTGGVSLPPTSTVSGSVEVAGDEILRSDCNGDGMFSGLSDGLTALNVQFVPGTPPPPCLAQCDANGDNTFNGLTDGLYMLSVQFVPGFQPPPAPYPDCGLGAEESIAALGCDVVTCP